MVAIFPIYELILSKHYAAPLLTCFYQGHDLLPALHLPGEGPGRARGGAAETGTGPLQVDTHTDLLSAESCMDLLPGNSRQII